MWTHGQYIVSRVPPACNPSGGVGAPCIPGGVLPDHVILTPFSNHAIYHTRRQLRPRWASPTGSVRTPLCVRRLENSSTLGNPSSSLPQNYEGTWPDLGQLIGQQLQNYPIVGQSVAHGRVADPFNAAGGSVPAGTHSFNQAQWYMDPRAQNPYS